MLCAECKGIEKEIEKLPDLLFGCGREALLPIATHARSSSISLWQLVNKDSLQNADYD